MCVSVRTGVACVWLRAVCASVCVWNVLSVCVMRLVCRPGVSMKILKKGWDVAPTLLDAMDGVALCIFDINAMLVLCTLLPWL